jgi:hypothetical protein
MNGDGRITFEWMEVGGYIWVSGDGKIICDGWRRECRIRIHIDERVIFGCMATRG